MCLMFMWEGVVPMECTQERHQTMYMHGKAETPCCWSVAERPCNMLVYLRNGICSDNRTCCHTEMETTDPTSYLTQSQFTDTGPTSPSTDPTTPGRVATGMLILKSPVYTRPGKIPHDASGNQTPDLLLSRRMLMRWMVKQTHAWLLNIPTT